MALDQQCRRFPTELPGRLGRHRAGVDRIEVAPGRQHLGPAAARRAGGAGRHQTPVEPGEQARRFRPRRMPRPPGAAPARSSRERRGSAASSARRRPRRRRAARPALSRRSTVSPAVRHGPGPASTAGRGPCHGSARSSASGSLAEAEIGGQRAQQRGVLRARRRGPGGRTRPATRRAARPRGSGRRRAARRGSASPSARTESRRACAAPRPVSSPAAMPQSPSSPAARARSRIAAASTATPARIAVRGLVIFVDQALELGHRPIAAGAGQRRGQMVDDHRLSAPLGLRSLAGIVDDERIEMRQRRRAPPRGSIRPTAPAPSPAAIRGCRACRDGSRHRRGTRRRARHRRRNRRAAAPAPDRDRSLSDRCCSRAPAGSAPRHCRRGSRGSRSGRNRAGPGGRTGRARPAPQRAATACCTGSGRVAKNAE